jgi:hypothetical protein
MDFVLNYKKTQVLYLSYIHGISGKFHITISFTRDFEPEWIQWQYTGGIVF